MRNARAIILDTRGNGGGNSAWADRLARAIFTEAVLRRHSPPGYESGVDWRASRGNAAFWRTWAEQMKQVGGVGLDAGLLPQLADAARPGVLTGVQVTGGRGPPAVVEPQPPQHRRAGHDGEGDYFEGLSGAIGGAEADGHDWEVESWTTSIWADSGRTSTTLMSTFL
jgi:hypothetical protein